MTAPTLGLALAAAAALVLAALLFAGQIAVTRLPRATLHEFEASDRPGSRRAAVAARRPVRSVRGATAARAVLEGFAVVALTVAVAATGWPWWQVVAVSAGVAALALIGPARMLPARLAERHPAGALRVGAGLLNLVAAPVRAVEDGSAEDAWRDMVERAATTEHLEVEDHEMMRSVIALGDTIVREVMVPRTEMITARADTSLRKALALFLRSGYSRMPVTGDSVDDLVGVLYLKDVVRRRYTVPDSDDVPVSDLVRPAEFVPEFKPVDDLLRVMQAGSFHMAMVVDEFGGIAGLVTVEDALEEIVGELTDEHDQAAPEVEELAAGRFRIPARLPLDDLGALFGLQIEDDDVDTAAGLLAKTIGKVPLVGSGAEVAGLSLTAERAEGRRRRLTTLIAERAPQRTEEGER